MSETGECEWLRLGMRVGDISETTGHESVVKTIVTARVQRL